MVGKSLVPAWYQGWSIRNLRPSPTVLDDGVHAGYVANLFGPPYYSLL